MKKRYILILSSVAIAIFILGVYVAAAEQISIKVGSTEISFLPLVIKSRAAVAPPGVLYVFPSTTTTDGDMGGYDGRGDICFQDNPNSHLCGWTEIDNAFDTQGVYFQNSFSPSWRPAYAWGHYDTDCESWTSNDFDEGGYIMIENIQTISMVRCHKTYPVTCCRQMPLP